MGELDGILGSVLPVVADVLPAVMDDDDGEEVGAVLDVVSGLLAGAPEDGRAEGSRDAVRGAAGPSRRGGAHDAERGSRPARVPDDAPPRHAPSEPARVVRAPLVLTPAEPVPFEPVRVQLPPVEQPPLEEGAEPAPAVEFARTVVASAADPGYTMPVPVTVV